MVYFDECLDSRDLGVEAIEAIAAHEHVPSAVAAELAAELLRTPEGLRCLGSMLLDNVGEALLRGQSERAEHLACVYRRFHASHP